MNLGSAMTRAAMSVAAAALLLTCTQESTSQPNRGEEPRPSLKYGASSGCGNIFLFAATSDRREFLVVSLDQSRPRLSTEPTVLDVSHPPGLLDVHIDLFDHPATEPYCTDVAGLEGPVSTWRAIRGVVTITVEPSILDESGKPTERFWAHALLESCVFEHEGEKPVFQEDRIQLDAIVGWAAG